MCAVPVNTGNRLKIYTPYLFLSLFRQPYLIHLLPYQPIKNEYDYCWQVAMVLQRLKTRDKV